MIENREIWTLVPAECWGVSCSECGHTTMVDDIPHGEQPSEKNFCEECTSRDVEVVTNRSGYSCMICDKEFDTWDPAWEQDEQDEHLLICESCWGK